MQLINSASANPNEALAVEVVEQLLLLGVRCVCLCPGGRNAPLLEVLDGLAKAQPIELLNFFEERNAGFFALGRAKRDRAPVAVVTTSGTAVAELYPAVIEAHYSGVPLIIVSADRPKTYRGSGAPQAIEQAHLFAQYAALSFDVDAPGVDWPWHRWRRDGPVQMNVCFDEPLLKGWAHQTPKHAEVTHLPPARIETTRATMALQALVRPLVILGALREPEDRTAVERLCVALGAPVLAEASSELRGAPALQPLLLTSGEALAQAALREGFFKSALRIGDVPSFRIWRDLEQRAELPVLSLSRRPFSGLTRPELIQGSIGAMLEGVALTAKFEPGEVAAFIERDRAKTHQRDQLLRELPRSEPALFQQLSVHIPDGAFVYLGNSLPIRLWNEFARPGVFSFHENRGANGIDGQVSSFLGGVQPGRENWAILGDLTTLYDLAGPWALRHLPAVDLKIVVVNNGGGRIFHRLFDNPRFQSNHETSFAPWAALWGMHYTTELQEARAGSIIEVFPNNADTQAYWQAIER